VGRGRGGIAAALRRVECEVVLAGISSDRLYPLRLQHELAAQLPRTSGVELIESPSGHDGFLTEHEAVAKVIGRALA
jgi:homoserine O-acetyltransferase